MTTLTAPTEVDIATTSHQVQVAADLAKAKAA